MLHLSIDHNQAMITSRIFFMCLNRPIPNYAIFFCQSLTIPDINPEQITALEGFFGVEDVSLALRSSGKCPCLLMASHLSLIRLSQRV